MTTHTPEQIEQLAARLDARWASQRTDAARVFELDHEQAAVMARRYEAEADECSLIALALRAYAEGMRREAVAPIGWAYRAGKDGPWHLAARRPNSTPGRVIRPVFLGDAFLAPSPSYAEVRRDALEEAAKIADDMYGEGPDYPYDGGAGSSGFNEATQRITKALRERAAAIRKLKEA